MSSNAVDADFAREATLEAKPEEVTEPEVIPELEPQPEGQPRPRVLKFPNPDPNKPKGFPKPSDWAKARNRLLKIMQKNTEDPFKVQPTLRRPKKGEIRFEYTLTQDDKEELLIPYRRYEKITIDQDQFFNMMNNDKATMGMRRFWCRFSKDLERKK